LSARRAADDRSTDTSACGVVFIDAEPAAILGWTAEAPSPALTVISRDTLGYRGKLTIHRMSDTARSADLLTQSETRWSCPPSSPMTTSVLLKVFLPDDWLPRAGGRPAGWNRDQLRAAERVA
jgi:hypothetical protein